MSEKPEFWDYYRAIGRYKEDDIYLNICSKETGDVTVYYITDDMKHTPARGIGFIVSLILNIGMLFLLFSNDFWPNIQADLNIVNYSMGWLIYILVYRRTYNKAIFEVAPEEEWKDSWEAKRKPRRILRAIGKYTAIVLILAVFFNTYCFTYLRYLYEGGAKISAAEVAIELPENTIKLDYSTPGGASFNIERLTYHEDMRMEISLHKIPEEVAVYLNGEDITWDYNDRVFQFFWEDDYFITQKHSFPDSDDFQEQNTLEIRTNSFSKVWTFALNPTKG